MTGGRIEVEFAIICDDVRQENTGKLIIIGAYPHDIAVSALPATLLLTIALGVTASEPTETETEIQVLFNGSVIRKGRGKFGVTEAGSGMVILPNILLNNLSDEGLLEFQIKFPDEEWRTVRKLPFKFNPAANA